MATTPDTHPDSNPDSSSDDIERLSPEDEQGRESVEVTPTDMAPDSPGTDGGTGGTGGTNHRVDRDITS